MWAPRDVLPPTGRWIVVVGVIVIGSILTMWLVINAIDPHNDFCTRTTRAAECEQPAPPTTF